MSGQGVRKKGVTTPPLYGVKKSKKEDSMVGLLFYGLFLLLFVVGCGGMKGVEQGQGGNRVVVEKKSEALHKVYFAYNDSEIDDVSASGLFNNAYKMNTGLKIRIEGHADERGTDEYNLELGRLRAESVKQYYIIFGVLVENIEIISYGEKKPVAFGSDEGSWSQNRRVEIFINN